jgi:hypothetical protein
VPVRDLVDPRNRFSVRHPSGYVGAGFETGGLFVWGFTAAVLDSALELAGLGLPWDRNRSVTLDVSRTGPTNIADPTPGIADPADEAAHEAELTAEQVPE